MASFIMPSTAFGVCSQSGSVKTALAFAAAARKSSTVFVLAAGRLALAAAKMNDRKRNENFIVVEVAHTCMRAPQQRQIQRNSVEREYATEAHCRWSSAHMGCNSQVAFDRGARLRNMRHDDPEIFPRLHSHLCRDRSNRTCCDLHGTRCQRFAGAAETPGVSRTPHGALRVCRIYVSWGDYFRRTWNHGCGFPSRGRSYFTCF